MQQDEGYSVLVKRCPVSASVSEIMLSYKIIVFKLI
jgi:hypothetical protein